MFLTDKNDEKNVLCPNNESKKEEFKVDRFIINNR